MVGILERVPADRASTEIQVPAIEAFLRACDAKDDFSYVFSVSPRSEIQGRSWRPAPPGPMRAPISWHCYGSGQRGTLESTHLRLDDVAFLRQGEIGAKAKRFISEWLATDAATFDVRQAGARAFRRLHDAGFDGASLAIECETGVVFFQSVHADAASLEIVVPMHLRWAHGAPALLLERGSDRRWRFRDVGVLVGLPADAVETISIE
jgi:hypothetical protein